MIQAVTVMILYPPFFGNDVFRVFRTDTRAMPVAHPAKPPALPDGKQNGKNRLAVMDYFIWDIKISQVYFPIYRKITYKTSHTIFVQFALLCHFSRILCKFSAIIRDLMDRHKTFDALHPKKSVLRFREQVDFKW